MNRPVGLWIVMFSGSILACGASPEADPPAATADRSADATAARPPRVLPLEHADRATVPDRPFKAAALLPLREGQWSYTVIAGKGDGKTERVRVEKRPDADAPWRIHRPGGRIDHVRVDETEGVVVVATEDLEHDVITVYEPAIPLLPKKAKPGETIRIETKLTVRPRDDRQRVTQRGTGTLKLTYDAKQVLHTELGDIPCQRLRLEWTADLTTADVERRTWRYYAPKTGLAAFKTREKVRALLFQWETNQTLLLTDHPGSDGAG